MRRSTGLLIAFATLSSLGLSSLLPYIPLFGREIGMPISFVGFLIFAYYGIEVVSRIPIGSLTDILGPGLVVVGGAVSLLFASFFYLLSSLSWHLLFAAQLLLGLGISITWVTIPAFITKGGGSLPTYTFSVGIGWLLGPPLGGFIRDSMGMYNLFTVFLLISASLLTLAIFFYRERKEVTKQVEESAQLESLEREATSLPSPPNVARRTLTSYSDALDLLRTKGKVLIASLVSFIMFMAFAIGSSLVPLYFSEIGLGSLLIGTLISVRTGSATLIRLATRNILEIGKKESILIIGTALTGLTMLLISMANFLPLLVFLSVIWGLGGGIYLPVVFGLIADSTSERERGIAMGLRGTLGTSGSAIGVLTFMNLADIFSVQSSLAWFGCFVVVFSGIILLIWKSWA